MTPTPESAHPRLPETPRAAVSNPSRETRWTRSVPDREGHYWYWREAAENPVMLRVFRHANGTGYVAFTADYRKFAVDELDGYWYWDGPLGNPDPPPPPES